MESLRARGHEEKQEDRNLKSVASNIRLKRIYDPQSDADGYRILTTRYWPRGVRKTAKNEYDTKTAPSRELLRAFKHDGLEWNEYVPRYLAEMEGIEAQAAIARFAVLARSQRITLMCVCEDENHCHRSLLRDLVVQAAEANQ